MKKLLLTSTTAAFGLLAVISSASADAGVTAVYSVSADKLWEAVDFHQPSEKIMPPIESSMREGDGLGALKVNKLNGGGEVHLQLVHYAPEEKAFNYIIQSSPLPVSNYVGEVRVTSLGENRSQLSWRGVYQPAGVPQEKADEILQGFYNAIAGRIGEMFPKE